jgi:hypothetical protein
MSIQEVAGVALHQQLERLLELLLVDFRGGSPLPCRSGPGLRMLGQDCLRSSQK